MPSNEPWFYNKSQICEGQICSRTNGVEYRPKGSCVVLYEIIKRTYFGRMSCIVELTSSLI